MTINPELQNSLVEGTRYEIMSVFKVNEPWEVEEYSLVPQRSFKAAVRKAMKAPALKVHYSDTDYYNNYTIMPVSASPTTGVEVVDTAKQAVKVKYVNMLGVMSDTPFNGVNVVITEYNDGSRVVIKEVR